MPIYEYQCSQCENRIEVLQKISDEHLKDCPRCFAPSLKKLVSAASFRLKGGGWYETDFKTGIKKKLAESDSKEKKADEPKTKNSETSGETVNPSMTEKKQDKKNSKVDPTQTSKKSDE